MGLFWIFFGSSLPQLLLGPGAMSAILVVASHNLIQPDEGTRNCASAASTLLVPTLQRQCFGAVQSHGDTFFVPFLFETVYSCFRLVPGRSVAVVADGIGLRWTRQCRCDRALAGQAADRPDGGDLA